MHLQQQSLISLISESSLRKFSILIPLSDKMLENIISKLYVGILADFFVICSTSFSYLVKIIIKTYTML